MVINLTFVCVALLCAILLATGRPLNISIKHTHVVENQEPVDNTDISQDARVSTEEKNISEIIQDILGVSDEG